MTEILRAITSIEAPFNMIILIVLIGCVCGIITGVAKQFRKYLCHRDEIELKRDMLASGMTADEIERVVRVKSASGGGINETS